MDLSAHDLDSTSLHSLFWDNEDLTVRFHSGGVYRYEGVPLETVTNILAAESVGSAFWKLVRSQPFPFQRVSS